MDPAPQDVWEPVSRSEWVALALIAIAWVVMLLWTPGSTLRDDPFRFAQIATTHGTPYRDFPVEYPPLETLVAVAIGDSSPLGVAVRAAFVNGLCTLGCWWLLRRHWSVETATVYLWCALPIQLFMPFRIDALSVVAILAAFVVADRRRERDAGLLAAAAVLVKLWPLAIVPAFVVRAQRRAAIWAVAAVVGGGLLWIGISGASAPGQVSGFRGATGWQVESTPGLLWQLFHPGDQLRLEDGALRVGSMLGWQVALLRIITVVVVALVWSRAGRRSVDPRGGPALASVAVVILLAPVLSPQYVAWLLPWAAIMSAERASSDVRVLTMATSVLAALAFAVYWGSRSPVELWAVSAAKVACIAGLAALGWMHANVDREVRRARSDV
jgi:hypothetical protein